MRNTLVLLAVTIFVGAAAYVYYSSDKNSNEIASGLSATPTAIITPEPTKREITPPPSDWRTFRSDDLGISFSYPPKMEIKENEDKTVRGLILGPSQSLGTEVYDGVILNFSTGTYSDGNLESYV